MLILQINKKARNSNRLKSWLNFGYCTIKTNLILIKTITEKQDAAAIEKLNRYKSEFDAPEFTIFKIECKEIINEK